MKESVVRINSKFNKRKERLIEKVNAKLVTRKICFLQNISVFNSTSSLK